MRYIAMQEAFELEINKLDDNLSKPTTNTTEYFLNAGLDKFWKTRYSAMNYKREGFEQTEKRIDDLRTLVQEESFENAAITTVNPSLYTVTLPENYVLLLGDTAGIQPADGVEIPCWEKMKKVIIQYTIQILQKVPQKLQIESKRIHYQSIIYIILKLDLLS